VAGRELVAGSSRQGDGIEVIPDVDHALKTLIEREAVDPAEVEVVFDAPTKEWAARRNGPTVDVYLYDIREDLRRRQRGFLNEYEGDRVTTRHQPPRYFKMSYLVAAWTQRPEDEHRLLASLLLCLLRYEALPPEVLTGSLAELGLAVPVTIALPPPEDRSFADVWTALGGELKPSLDVVVTAPVASGQSFPAGPPVQWPTTLIAEGLNGSVPAETLRRGATPAATRDDGAPATSVRIRKRQKRIGSSP
jgi:Pvc16 N-terminal domain